METAGIEDSKWDKDNTRVNRRQEGGGKTDLTFAFDSVKKRIKGGFELSICNYILEKGHKTYIAKEGQNEYT